MKHRLIAGSAAAACVGFAAHGAEAQVIIQTTSDGYMDLYDYVSDGRTNYTYDTRVTAYVDGVVFDDRFFLYSIDSAGVREQVAAMQRPVAWAMDGAPAVITWSAPELVRWEEEITDIFTETSTTTRTRTVVTVTRTSGDHPNPFVLIDFRESCGTTGVSGDTNFGDGMGRLAQCDGGYEIEVQPGEIVVNTHTTYITETIETSFTNEDIRVTNDWEIQGTSHLIGTVHAAAQSGLFDAGRGFIGRIGAPREGPGPREGVTAWAGGWGREARTRSDGGPPGSERQATGLHGGMSVARGPFSAGLAFDQSETDVSADGAPETARAELTQIGLHAEVGTDGWFLAGAAGFGDGDVRAAHGDTGLGGVSDADYGVSLRAGSIAGGRRLDLGRVTVTPFLGADRIWLTTDGFTETGGFAPTSPESEAERTTVWGGLGAEIDWMSADGWRIALGGRVRAFAVTDGGAPTMPVAFAALPDEALTIRGAGEDASGLEWRASVSADLGERVSARLSGGLVDGDATWSQEWSAALVVRW